MYTHNGEKYFIVDSHIHIWDGRPENQKNIHGKQFIDTFFGYHSNLSPDEEKWAYEDFLYYGPEGVERDVFEEGQVDHAILQTTMLTDFYHNTFSPNELNWKFAQDNAHRVTYNHAYDPRYGESGLTQLGKDAEKYDLKGVKLYTAEWHGDSRGYRLDDPWSRRYLEKCIDLGIKNIHVHKGPTLRPLDMDAFSVRDVDGVASDYTELNFIVEHCGLPRLDEFCWIATQESNVHAGLSVVMPFIHTRPRYFAEMIGEMLYWIGDEKMQFSSDYALWKPKWLIEAFLDFQIPEDMQGEYGQLTIENKKRILGLNTAAMYGIDVPREFQVLGGTDADRGKQEVVAGAEA